MWGVRSKHEMQMQKQAGGEVCVLERGYIGDRTQWSSVSFGGKLNGRAQFRGVQDDPRRFEQHFGHMLKPWEKRDGYALIMGQVASDQAVRHVDIGKWYRQVAAYLKGHDVRFRPHPGAVRRGQVDNVPDATRIDGTLEDAINGASFVVTFNSNSAVDAVLAGVPTVAVDPGSMAWDVTSHDIRDPLVTPDRTQWVSRLAWKQWTDDEMASGFCWDHVGSMEKAA